MPFKTPFSRISRIYSCIFLLLLTLPVFWGDVHAAGLGKLSVFSALGQPLRAEIELTSVSKNELGTLKIKLASIEAFHRANLEFNPILQSARFTLGQRDARYFVTITSTQAMNEPFVSLLLELNWNDGRLLREYTFLLDPPELQNAPAAQSLQLTQTLNSTNAGNESDATEQSEALKAAKATKAAKVAKPANPNQEKIAKKPKVIQAQAAANNPAPVFTPTLVPATQIGEKNLAKDKKPNKADATNATNAAINTAEDKLQVSRGLALALSLSLSSPPSSVGGATTSTRSQATPRVEEKSRIVMPEDKIAKDKMIADATERIKELEKNVSDLQKFVQAKSNNPQFVQTDTIQAASATTQQQNALQAAQALISNLPTFAPPAAVSPNAAKSVWTEQIFVREWMGDLRFISAALVVLIGVIAGGVAFLRRRKKDDFDSYAASLADADHDKSRRQPLKREPSVDVSSLANDAATTPQFDFSSINLDLDESLDVHDTSDTHDVIDIVKETPNKSNLDSSINVKLDLALAYASIGDKQGARELLDEVIKNGSVEQVAKATALLKKIVR